MSIFELYLITRLDGIQVVFILTSIFLLFAFTIFGIAALVDDKWAEYKKAIKLLFISGMTCLILSIMIPTTKEIALIASVHVLTNNKELTELSKKSTIVLHKLMNTYLENNKGEEK